MPRFYELFQRLRQKVKGSMGILETPAPPATKRIAYGTGEYHFGDLRLPEGNAPFPVVVNIHGGFWRSQYSLDHAGHLCAALTAQGIATWNIEYRRLGHKDGGWTGTFEDVAAAVDFLPTLAQSHTLDVTRVIVMGHSAGGHLALWAAARPHFTADHPLYSPAPFAFRGVVALAPVADLALAWNLRLSNMVVEQLMGGSPGTQPERYAAASPIELLPLQIPQILIHGEQDMVVPIAISEEYLQRAVAKGDRCVLERLPRTAHFEIIDPFTAQWGVVQRAAQSLL